MRRGARPTTSGSGRLSAARAQAPNDPYVDLIAGEVALRQGKLAEAEKAFTSRSSMAAPHVRSGAWRVWRWRGPTKPHRRLPSKRRWALAAARRGAHRGRTHSCSEGKEDAPSTSCVRRSASSRSTISSCGRASLRSRWATPLLGYIHEARGRLHLARKAYDDALTADPYLVDALLGAGRVMLREKRCNDALARFESALNIAQKWRTPLALSGRKADVEARLGQGRALLALEREPDAEGVLSTLMTENPNDAEIILAAVRPKKRWSTRTSAETLLKKSIDLAPTSFAGYLALSQFYFKQNEADKASETLNQAAAKVEENAEMRRMLGQSRAGT